jgi:transposase
VLHSDPTDPPRCRANKKRGRGTYENDRPPIFGIKARGSGEVRYFVRHNSDGVTCRDVVTRTIPKGANLYTDELSSYIAVGRDWCRIHATVKHGKDKETGYREWARDDDGDGVREVHCNGCEGPGAALRTYLRGFRVVNKRYLWDYVAVFEAATNSKRITTSMIQAFCFGFRGAHLDYA